MPSNYIKLLFSDITEDQSAILVAQLSEIGYEGFVETTGQLEAFIPEGQYDAASLASIETSMDVRCTEAIIPPQNWNALWESNFEPVLVDDFVAIRASFHAPITDVAHEIVITPKMSFGTGHHATTHMMLQLMRQLNWSQKTAFDFGTGTGVLAIMAEKLGAAHIFAIDNEDWTVENARENASANACSKIDVALSDKVSTGHAYQITLANINKNVLLQFVQELAAITQEDLLLSGLLVEDELDIRQAYEAAGFRHRQTVNRDKWIALHFVR
jgi:ribosomal protein L11 methyltransferase